MLIISHQMKIFAVILFMTQSVCLAGADLTGESLTPIGDVPRDISEGIASYDTGDYEKAIVEYNLAISKHQGNGHLYYNLGNAFYRNEQRGESVAAFLHARRLLPRDPDVKENLKFVTGKNKDQLESELPKSFLRGAAFWVGSVTNRELAFLAAIVFAFASLLLIPTIFAPRFELLRSAGIGMMVVGLFAAFAFTINLSQDEKWGAITAPVAKVKSGPGSQNTVVFELREGAPFVARQKENSWYQIELSDGKIGWVSAADARVYSF